MENLNAEHIANVLEVEIGFSDGKFTKIEVSVLKDALALITSQEQRIKELAEELDDAKRDTIPKLRLSLERANAMGVEADKTIEKLAEENERLKVDNEILKMPRATIFEIGDAFDRGRIKGRADTVRKMQNELKKTFSAICKGEMVDLYRIIDQIAKELLESCDG